MTEFVLVVARKADFPPLKMRVFLSSFVSTLLYGEKVNKTMTILTRLLSVPYNLPSYQDMHQACLDPLSLENPEEFQWVA